MKRAWTWVEWRLEDGSHWLRERIPFVVLTKHSLYEHEKGAFELGRDHERSRLNPTPPPKPPRRLHAVH